VTLASIVEKETGAPEERAHIACVFYNRLRARPAWRLETDPTVIYAAILADPHFDGNLKRTHLRDLDSPYNTYRHVGLPPGPIANPGRAALQAVSLPSTCGDFFFVSSNHGRHVFCPDLACHNRAVQRWQIDYFRNPTRRGMPSAPLPEVIRPPSAPSAPAPDRPGGPPGRRRSPPSYSPSRVPGSRSPPR
ncbi:MAG: endolytic transglycosylase MltG, partial [Deltaproteobacteria bacterium]